MTEEKAYNCSHCKDEGGMDFCCYAPFSDPEDMCHDCLERVSKCPYCGKRLGWKEENDGERN